MKPGLTAVIVSIAFGSVPPIEPPEEMRCFRDIDAAPYSGTTTVDIPFTYEAERAEATTIEVKFFDETHDGALIYARQIEPTLMFSSHVALPTYLQQASAATLRFIARNATFGIARDVPIYHTTSLHVSTFLEGEDTVVGIANFVSVDAMSNLIIRAEELRFQGFLDQIVTPTFGSFSFEGFHYYFLLLLKTLRQANIIYAPNRSKERCRVV